jgi:hypothetical protein
MDLGVACQKLVEDLECGIEDQVVSDLDHS